MTTQSELISFIGSLPQLNKNEFCLTFNGIGNRLTNDSDLNAAEKIIRFFYEKEFHFIVTLDDAYESIDSLLMRTSDLDLSINILVPFGLIGGEINGNRVASEALINKWRSGRAHV